MIKMIKLTDTVSITVDKCGYVDLFCNGRWFGVYSGTELKLSIGIAAIDSGNFDCPDLDSVITTIRTVDRIFGLSKINSKNSCYSSKDKV